MTGRGLWIPAFFYGGLYGWTEVWEQVWARASLSGAARRKRLYRRNCERVAVAGRNCRFAIEAGATRGGGAARCKGKAGGRRQKTAPVQISARNLPRTGTVVQHIPNLPYGVLMEKKMKRFWLYVLPAVLAVPAALLGRSFVQYAGQRPSSRRASGHRPRERTMVYITDFGTRYHKAGCRALLHSKTAHKVALEDLPEQYDACHDCQPPALRRATAGS